MINMRKTVKKRNQNLLQKKNKNVFQLLGDDCVLQTPRFPLGDFRPGGVVPLRQVPPQTVLRLRLIVYRTELNGCFVMFVWCETFPRCLSIDG